jgi:hypothetical protein
LILSPSSFLLRQTFWALSAQSIQTLQVEARGGACLFSLAGAEEPHQVAV